MKFQNYLICTASGEIFRGLFVSLAFAIGIWYDMKMKKEEQELEVIVYGEIDIKKIPKEILDAFIAALEDEMCKMLKEEK